MQSGVSTFMLIENMLTFVALLNMKIFGIKLGVCTSTTPTKLAVKTSLNSNLGSQQQVSDKRIFAKRRVFNGCKTLFYTMPELR